MKIYECTFQPATTHSSVLVIKCIGKNKKQALVAAQAAFSKVGGNPDWLTIKMIRKAK